MDKSKQNEITLNPHVEFGEFVYWHGHKQMICPGCGGDFLHHGRVDVFQRLKGEDGDAFRFRLNDGASLETSLVPEVDVPGRRGSIEIRFSCESCELDENDNQQDVYFVLQIIQHKGQTFLSWVRVEK